MMKSFAFCVKPSLIRCLGPMFTGNCGCDRKILCTNSPAPCSVPRLPLLVRVRKIQFLEATASSFTKPSLVRGVNLNILVLSATVYTLVSNVIFVANLSEIFPDQSVLPSQVLLPTPINLNRLEPYLNGYFPDIVSTLVSGFKNGFPLHFSGIVNTQKGKNLPSALANPTVVDQKLAKELAALRLAGPFTTPPFHPFRVSPLGLVPKKIFGEFRLIHHLSFPRGSSVNNGIATENTSVHYATVADAIRLSNSHFVHLLVCCWPQRKRWGLRPPYLSPELSWILSSLNRVYPEISCKNARSLSANFYGAKKLLCAKCSPSLALLCAALSAQVGHFCVA